MGLPDAANEPQKRLDACNQCIQTCHEYLLLCLHDPAIQNKPSLKTRNAADLCKLYANLCDDSAPEYAVFNDNHCKSCADVCNACPHECKITA